MQFFSKTCNGISDLALVWYSTLIVMLTSHDNQKKCSQKKMLCMVG